jgi:hypothetical protein
MARGISQSGRDVGSALRSTRGVKDGFEGRAVGGKTINPAVVKAGLAPVPGVAVNAFRQDYWTGNRRQPKKESEF